MMRSLSAKTVVQTLFFGAIGFALTFGCGHPSNNETASEQDAGSPSLRPGPGRAGNSKLCAPDERVKNNACVPCHPGTNNKAGDDPFGDDTSCDATLCPSNRRVRNNACVPCLAGTTNEAGDDASGSDTSCGETLCAENESVQSNECAACAEGSTNEAGDDASGSNTSCDPKLCAADEFVQNNECVTCPRGTTNEAGDDVAGDDTGCSDACAKALGVVNCESYIKASNTEADDLFGNKVALAGDTLVVGAPAESSDATGVDGDQNNNYAPASGAVYVFVRSGSGWTQQAYIKASNTDENDHFGIAVALDGDILAVGASGEASNATGVGGDQFDNDAPASGAAYVFVRSGSTWTQEAYIKASNADDHDHFGTAVALDRGTLAVGARVGWSSAVSVFVRSGSTWTQEACIKASNARWDDRLGMALAIDGDTIAVGTPGEYLYESDIRYYEDVGAVYVFVRSDSTWTQQAFFRAPEYEHELRFGGSVALDGDTLAVASSDAVYVLVRSGSTWTKQAHIEFTGASVALDDDTLAVGVWDHSYAIGVGDIQTNRDAPFSGAVYVFVRSGSTWAQQAYTKAFNTDEDDQFGVSLALDGDTLAVGATGEDSNATGVHGDQSSNGAEKSGAVYTYHVAP
ncbi:MAG: hypothetical protein RJA70_2765 [Pseudomonadota bacterium]|jgi:hypothetical protein